MESIVCHYGKPGMHWGIRKKRSQSTTHVAKITPKQKHMSEMTNEELAAHNQRKQLEKTYLSFQPKPKVSKGKQFANAVAKNVLAPVAIEVGRAYTKQVLNDLKNKKK